MMITQQIAINDDVVTSESKLRQRQIQGRKVAYYLTMIVGTNTLANDCANSAIPSFAVSSDDVAAMWSFVRSLLHTITCGRRAGPLQQSSTADDALQLED